MTIKIQILGTGCAKCTTLAANAEAAAKAAGVEYQIEKVTDLQQIMVFGVMVTPALVINGQVVSSGSVLSAEEIGKHLAVPGDTTPKQACGCSGGCCPVKPPEPKAGTPGCGCGCGGTGDKKATIVRMLAFPLIILAVAGILWLKTQNTASAPSTPPPQASETATPAKVPAAVPAPLPLPKLVDLGAVGCKPCKIMDGVLEELRQAYPGKLAVEFINVRTDESKAEAYKITLIPTQIWLDANGKELYRHEGVISAVDIAAKFKELGIDLGTPAAATPATQNQPAAPAAEGQ